MLCGWALGALLLGGVLFGSNACAGIVYSGDIAIEVRFDIDVLDGSKNQPVLLDFDGFANGGF